MERSITYNKANKEYTFKFYSLNPANIIFQVVDKETGKFSKKNIKYNYSIGCGYTFQIQKTQLKSEKTIESFFDFIQELITNNFALCWIDNICSGLEKMKENKNI